MVIAFEIVLLVIMLFSALVVAGERKNPSAGDAVLTVFIASTAAFIASVMLL